METDALVVGAGPVGLFQVFELGLLEMRAHVVDALPFVGGQCMALYADKPIYDIPALARCTGRELIERLQVQIAPFAPALHLGQQVTRLMRQDDGRFAVESSDGNRWQAKTVVIAGGVGAFLPRRLALDGLEAHEGTQVFNGTAEAPSLAGQRVVVVGGDDTALEAALQASDEPVGAMDVTLLHRRDVFEAEPALLAAFAAARSAGRIQVRVGQAVGFGAREGRLSRLDIVSREGLTEALPLDVLLVRLGLSPRLGPIADWGLALARKQLSVDTASFQTSQPGIFAVGDINTYPGKKKLIVSGFHEATLAAFGAAARVFPDRQAPLQYTTTSPRLHELLGVRPGAGG